MPHTCIGETLPCIQVKPCVFTFWPTKTALGDRRYNGVDDCGEPCRVAQLEWMRKDLEAANATSTGFNVIGWTIDPNKKSAIDVHVYIYHGSNAPAGYATKANASRPDVGAAYPAYGAKHGYNFNVPAPKGTSTVCAYGIDYGAGQNALLGCIDATR